MYGCDSTLLQALAENYHNDCLEWNRYLRRQAMSHTKTFFTIDGTKYSTSHEAARAARLSKFEDDQLIAERYSFSNEFN
ncbi:hypothetical protein TNCV_2462201 [Trichonephila clavipes]|nr:hypothetical protein TNCV_2462201 [Trichonephila clavipes]